MNDKITTTLKNELLEMALKQRRSSLDYKHPKMKGWKQNEDLYYIRESKKYIIHRHNSPLPVMSGMIDTFLAKINDTISILFTPHGEEDNHKAEICTALWKHDSEVEYFEQTDRIVKKNAALCGRGIYKVTGSANPSYKTCLIPVSHFLFHCEPLGGYSLDNHVFCGQDGIYKTAWDLEEGVKNKMYDKKDTEKLIALQGDEFKGVSTNNLDFLNSTSANSLYEKESYYIGETHFNMTEWYMTYKGVRYYLLFEPQMKICIRCAKLKDILKSNKIPYVSFATHPELNVFWSKALADDIRPLAVEMRVLLNQTLDNIQKRNWAQKIVDVNAITDISSLGYRADGIIPVDVRSGQTVQGAITLIETPDTTNSTLALMNTLRGMLGQDTGVTAGAQGASDQKAVSIYRGNMLEIADRFRKTGNEYQRAWKEIGERYLWNIKQYCSAKDAKKIIGAEAHDFNEDVIDEWRPKLDFIIQLESQDLAKKQAETRTKLDALALVQQLAPLNQKAAGKQILINGGFGGQEAEILLSADGEIDTEIKSDAYRSIQQILEGKEPKMYYNATTYFMQILFDYATKKCENEKVSNKILMYAQQHANIAAENMQRRATSTGTDQVRELERSQQSNGGLDTNVVPNASSLNLKSPNTN